MRVVQQTSVGAIPDTALSLLTSEHPFFRHGHGLAGNGWPAHRPRHAGRRAVECIHRSLEWWPESRLWLARRPMGWPDRPYARLGNRLLLDSRLLRRVRPLLSSTRALFTCFPSIYYLYTLIRRPRLILDFALTLVFNHLVLTTYYSASIPTSLFFWLVMIAGSAVMIILAEQLCVKREMAEGLQVAPLPSSDEEAEEMEMGLLPRNSG
jgi:hypothetical protein